MGGKSFVKELKRLSLLRAHVSNELDLLMEMGLVTFEPYERLKVENMMVSRLDEFLKSAIGGQDDIGRTAGGAEQAQGEAAPA